MKLTLVKGGRSYTETDAKERIREIVKTQAQKEEDAKYKQYEQASDNYGATLGQIMRGEAGKADLRKAVTAYDRAIEGLKSTSSFNKEV